MLIIVYNFMLLYSCGFGLLFINGHIFGNLSARPGTEVIKLFSCSTRLITEFQLLIKTKMLKINTFLVIKLSYAVIIMLINVKMPTCLVF